MKKLIFALVLISFLSACGFTKEKLGIAQKAPDETMVTTRKPLSIPPEYDLRPLNTTQKGE